MSHWNLKAFIPISLGFHLLLFSGITVLFPEFRINRTPPLHLEVSLLPSAPTVMAVEKPTPKVVPQKPKTEPERQEILPSPVTKEESLPRETLLPELPPPVETVVSKTPVQQPEPIPPKDPAKQEEKQESQVKEVKRTVSTAVTVSSFPEAIPVMTLKESAPSPREASLIEETFPVPISSSRSRARPHSPALENGSQNGSAVSLLSPPSPDGQVIPVRPREDENSKPVYPSDARKKGHQGVVLLRVEVLANGRVGQVEMKKSSGHEMLDLSALAAVKKWKFTPAKKGENAIPSWVNIPIKFQLQ